MNVRITENSIKSLIIQNSTTFILDLQRNGLSYRNSNHSNFSCFCEFFEILIQLLYATTVYILFQIMGGLCQTCGWFFGMFKYSSEIQKFEPLRQFNFPFFGIDINLHENIERCILETFNIRNERRIERIFHLFSFLISKSL